MVQFLLHIITVLGRNVAHLYLQDSAEFQRAMLLANPLIAGTTMRADAIVPATFSLSVSTLRSLPAFIGDAARAIILRNG